MHICFLYTWFHSDIYIYARQCKYACMYMCIHILYIYMKLHIYMLNYTLGSACSIIYGVFAYTYKFMKNYTFIRIIYIYRLAAMSHSKDDWGAWSQEEGGSSTSTVDEEKKNPYLPKAKTIQRLDAYSSIFQAVSLQCSDLRGLFISRYWKGLALRRRNMLRY